MNIMSKNNMLAVLLITGILFTACSDTDDTQNDREYVTTGLNTYTMIVNASKVSDTTTRALSLEGSVLNATWTVGEEVKVFAGNTEIGTLSAQSSGINTLLKGNLTTAPNINDVLTLRYLSPKYENQEGTLEYIAANCDYAIATVTVDDITDGTITTNENATFSNQQAIVKFTLTDATSSSISTSRLIVNANGNRYTITPTSPTNIFYVAIPGFSFTDKMFNLVATVGDNTYTYAKYISDLSNGQYYTIGVKMKQVIPVDLGLPSGTLWASMNVGANNPNEAGLYFAWGETMPKESYYESNYKYFNGSDNSLTKYCYDSDYGYDGFTDNLTVLEAEDDAATANWGTSWHIPTQTQWEELLNSNYTTTDWNIDVTEGVRITSKINSNYIFLPAAGYKSNYDLQYNLTHCYYLSSTLSYNAPSNIMHMLSHHSAVGWSATGLRFWGQSVRPVRAVN